MGHLFRNQLTEWMSEDGRVALKIMELVEATQRDPFGGIGKPERLRHKDGNVWSRRIDDGNRLVYDINGATIVFVSCKDHYDDR